MYDPTKSYRCIIIRARAIREVDDLLPKYSAVIDSLCPCSKEEFDKGFNKAFYSYAISKSKGNTNEKNIEKTLANHRTEISGSLFGMHYEDNGFVYATERTKKFINDNDQPAFFKDWLIKMQFPNGMQKSQTYMSMIEDKIRCHPYSILLKVLEYAKNNNIILTKQDLGYYILNSEDVLKGHASPEEVWKVIKQDKDLRVIRKLIYPKGATTSYFQYIMDQLQYLQLANLITLDKQNVYLNTHEKKAIEQFISLWDKPLGFDVYKYNLSDSKSRKIFEHNWNIYYGRVSNCVDNLSTPIFALTSFHKNGWKPSANILNTNKNKMLLGDDGEAYVYEFEKKRVTAYNSRLANKVLALGKTKGLGYDIQSVVAAGNAIEAEYSRYIEVKSTKRVTVPSINNNEWIDTINITRNEWIAAQQFEQFYSIYRVYFTRDGITMYVLKNPYKKSKSGEISVVPMIYRMDFQGNSIDEVL